ncbi:hypothetical protein ACRAWG_26765 [Methylobacterium sp. P31]
MNEPAKGHPAMITRLAAAAGLLALSASLALAQTATPAPAEPAFKTGSNIMEEWQVAKVGLAQTLTTAEPQGDAKGGRHRLRFR